MLCLSSMAIGKNDVIELFRWTISVRSWERPSVEIMPLGLLFSI